jgi:hypothetical protein
VEAARERAAKEVVESAVEVKGRARRAAVVVWRDGRLAQPVGSWAVEAMVVVVRVAGRMVVDAAAAKEVAA